MASASPGPGPGPPGPGDAERVGQLVRGRRIQASGWLVEDEDGRVTEQDPGDRDPLPLAAGQHAAALPDGGAVTVRQGGNEIAR